MARKTDDRVVEVEKKLSASAESLLDATAALLSERPTLEVALSEIAKRSGLNSALIKYYFGNKEGLLLALLVRDAEKHMSALQHLVDMALPADQKLKIHISGIINAYYRSPYLNRLIHFMIESGQPDSQNKVAEIYVRPLVAAYRAMIAQGLEEGVFRPVDPALLYYSLVGSCDSIFNNAYSLGVVANEPGISDELKQRYTEHVTEIALRGLRA